MTFSLANDGNEWSFDCGHDSVTLVVDVIVQEVRIGSHENSLQLRTCCFLKDKSF